MLTQTGAMKAASSLAEKQNRADKLGCFAVILAQERTGQTLFSGRPGGTRTLTGVIKFNGLRGLLAPEGGGILALEIHNSFVEHSLRSLSS